ncbi:hypothetical protein KP509_34G002500 [Ceratopteris richardii]|uniref:Probable purine permease n=1 Tax=Ceratopteris richardii TaxID=49495 RepID=A0A8T2QII8_CERRI|nr:hypothetical protein KP509_34G002500 [Ceratopteris richardii]
MSVSEHLSFATSTYSLEMEATAGRTTSVEAPIKTTSSGSIRLASCGSDLSLCVDSISIIRLSAQVHDEPGNSMNGSEQMGIELGMESAAVNTDVQKSSMADPWIAKPVFFGKDTVYWLLMAASSAALVLGLSSATLLGRLYFVYGGSRRWLYTWVECTGWPILIPPLLFCYWRYNIKPSSLTPALLFTFFVMGCLTALTNLLYSWGLSYLPVSTNSLLCSSQLAFNAMFSYALVRQKITPYIINSIVTITLGTVLLAVGSGSDHPPGTTRSQYIIGFVVTIIASALFALTLPLIELIYRRIVGRTSFARVLEVQIGIQVVASVFSLVGMGVAGDFAAMKAEAMAFETGMAAYINTLLWSAVGWQLYLLGGVGIVFLASSLLSCSFMTAMIPVLPLLAVVFFHDDFSAEKAIAMVLSIWGFISYLYGGYTDHTQTKNCNADPLTGIC